MTDEPLPDGPVTLTPLAGVDLVAVAPRARTGGLPVAVRLVDDATARRVEALVSAGPTAGACRRAHPAHPALHPAGTGSTVRARRALGRLVARAARTDEYAARPDGGS